MSTSPSPSTSPITVAIWGASGATGGELLRQCLDDDRIGEIRAFVRRDLEVADEQLRQVLVEDFLDAESYHAALDGIDVAFWCLGVSQSAVSEEQRYREITVDYATVAASALIDANPEVGFHFVSGMGAGSRGGLRPMWARVKGEAEAALGGMGFRRLVIWRPGYIHVAGGRGNATGFERLWEIISPLFRLVPNLVNPSTAIARAMRCEVFENGGAEGSELRLARDILRLAGEG